MIKNIVKFIDKVLLHNYTTQEITMIKACPPGGAAVVYQHEIYTWGIYIYDQY